MIPKELLDLIACPKCKGEVIYDEVKNILICQRCKLYYPIEDDIPILLIDSAKPLEGPEKASQERNT
ncbi:MAG: Trm112 family protein [Acidobacteria bacterium]|nr:MAG: Trm112 family protein [Acidobacteriota bacterium]